MNALSRYWPAIRQVLYLLIAAGLVVAVAVGRVTQEQSEAWLGQLSGILGAVGLVLASLNITRPGQLPPRVETPAPTLPVHVDEIRAQVEAAAGQAARTADEFTRQAIDALNRARE